MGLEDLDERWWEATTTGELLKTVWALYNTNRALASWNNAVKLARVVAARAKRPGAKPPVSRSVYWAARRRYLAVAHLWAAWCIREGRFGTRPEIGYDGYAEFNSFLAESEIIRRWGQAYLSSRKSSVPILPSELWYVGEDWRPQISQHSHHPGIFIGIYEALGSTAETNLNLSIFFRTNFFRSRTSLYVLSICSSHSSLRGEMLLAASFGFESRVPRLFSRSPRSIGLQPVGRRAWPECRALRQHNESVS